MKIASTWPPAWWFVKTGVGLTLIIYTLYVALSPQGADVLQGKSLYVGQVLAVVGALISLGHYVLLKRSVVNVRSPKVLMQEGGLYGGLRHPMYFGDLVLMVGFAVMSHLPLAIALAVLGGISLVLLCKAEDTVLESAFGDAFLSWKIQTKMLVPHMF